MIYEPSTIAVVVFFLFVGVTLGLSFWLGRKAKSSEGYFAAHGQIPWFINGVAFAGDYLSAASFLGICGMIAFYGYDGFLYSIGFLAGWIVALFVVAEPLKRLGKYTFADALDAKFNSRGIKLAAGISTLVVSVFYLIPQMVGAGVLVQPLLGFGHATGVIIVGITVILIVVFAGMVSTTWVQFLKGSLLVVFSALLVWMILDRGLETTSTTHVDNPQTPAAAWEDFNRGHADSLPAANLESHVQSLGGTVLPPDGDWKKFESPSEPLQLIRLQHPENGLTVWAVQPGSEPETISVHRAQTHQTRPDGTVFVNGRPKGTRRGEPELLPVGHIVALEDGQQKTGPLGPLSFFKQIRNGSMLLWREKKITDPDGTITRVFYPKLTTGANVLRPGEHPKFAGIRSDQPIRKLNFVSLMLALFCGTASLPHILIRYYTVRDAAAARKSTIVGIATIGFFYVLTLYLGLGAMTSGAMDVTSSNMSAPLLARSISEWLFAAISAIAFTTVLGTVSGLILASAGAVVHDLFAGAFGIEMNDATKVRAAKLTSVVVGSIAIVLGILFKGLNVGYLVGWAFSVAASANLPALVMLLFWKRTTHQGIIAAIIVGVVTSLGWILVSADTFSTVYGLSAEDAWVPFSQPGIVTIPLGFLTLIVVSLLTRPAETNASAPS